MDNAFIAVITALAIAYIALQYSALRAKYDSLFSWYADLSTTNPGLQPSIGPTRIALSYERPWLARLMTRPISQEMGEFMLRLVQQEKINPSYLITGPAAYVDPSLDPVNELNLKVASQSAWEVAGDKGNPLWLGGIPYNSRLVLGYRCQIGQGSICGGADDIQGDLSLLTLWMHGYEEYVRQRFTSGATSVLQEWNYMFAQDAVVPIDTGNGCDAGMIASDGISAAIGAAGVGAMLGAPEGGIGAIPGAIAGFIVGFGGSLLGKTKCL